VQNAIAFANNDLVTIAWSVEHRPDACMGFALYRIDDKGKERALPSHAVFPGYQIKPGQTTADFPVQKFYWKDPYARLEADRTGHRKFRYKIVPLEGKPGALTPMNLPQMVTNEVEISAAISSGLYAYFNRGLISTQRVSRAFKSKPVPKSLVALVSKPGNALRLSLAGGMITALTGFVDRARSTGTIYAALYELGDEELISKLEQLGKRLSIVLSNAAQTTTVIDKKTKKKTRTTTDGNAGARARLKSTAGVELDRIMPANHIGHNKFLVYEDGHAKPQAVLFGATNWTSTGLCTQTNNTVVIENPGLAKRYRDYWNRLAADTKAAKGQPKALQGTTLRTWDHGSRQFSLADQSSLDSWFSPNTPKARSRSKNEARPVDMAELIQRVDAAKHSILFLAFNPGTPSIANWAAAAQRKNKDLFVRGCVTNKGTAENYYYELKGMTPPKRPKGAKVPYKEDPRVVGAEALDETIPVGWKRELLNAGFAIIHDKVVVIDAFSDDCVVVTGSHNLGYKASYDNDENLVIVDGNKRLASAYATHVLDVYDHFAWRWKVQRDGLSATKQSLKDVPAEWLNQYFGPDDKIKTAQLKFWMGARP
jgi:phosphatidylserine/phosphatidylglycerophosphate/cardiolipin synthase-like enzyme